VAQQSQLTLIPIDRVAADRPFYSGKHRRHGMNLQVIASPSGKILWVSGTTSAPGTPCKVRDLDFCDTVAVAFSGDPQMPYAQMPGPASADQNPD
jgi:hypothetical protein